MKQLILAMTMVSFLSTNVILPLGEHKKQIIVANDEKYNEGDVARLKRLGTLHVVAVVLSGCIGAATGSLVRYFEQQLNIESSPLALFLILLSWSLESELRGEIIAGLQENLDAHGFSHKKSLMYRVAQLASWCAYLRDYIK